MISWWLCTSHPQQGASIFPLTPCPPREHWLALFEWLSLVGKKYPLALSLSLSFGGEVGSGVEGDPVWLYTTCTRPFLLNIWDCRSVESRNKKKKVTFGRVSSKAICYPCRSPLGVGQRLWACGRRRWATFIFLLFLPKPSGVSEALCCSISVQWHRVF